ncbi:hypothetical protein [Mechercharimyces sp. CAU 1602]|nr:hypothetical protein [Mechercharimyces sp. CAU 1602]MCS1351130.1 hypothetical protein [Mechercharimyces sp. CAU 1602]
MKKYKLSILLIAVLTILLPSLPTSEDIATKVPPIQYYEPDGP